MKLFNRTVINQDKKWNLSVESQKISNIVCLKFVCDGVTAYCRFDLVQNIFLDAPPCQCKVIVPENQL